jgi:hypothetical protein
MMERGQLQTDQLRNRESDHHQIADKPENSDFLKIAR